jgi:hypothetical protein
LRVEKFDTLARNAFWHFLHILLCMKILIFTEITLLFPKIKCEPQESNAVGKADFSVSKKYVITIKYGLTL